MPSGEGQYLLRQLPLCTTHMPVPSTARPCPCPLLLPGNQTTAPTSSLCPPLFPRTMPPQFPDTPAFSKIAELPATFSVLQFMPARGGQGLILAVLAPVVTTQGLLVPVSHFPAHSSHLCLRELSKMSRHPDKHLNPTSYLRLSFHLPAQKHSLSRSHRT